MSDPNTPRTDANPWTPAVIVQAAKELVTALLGLLIVIYTLWLANTAMGYAANDVQMGNAKDVLLLVLGLTGVVIGYYFGRVPADARAEQATREANKATAEAEGVAAGAAAAADQIDNILARASDNGASSAAAAAPRSAAQQDGAATAEELRRVRNTLRSLSRL